MNKVITVSRQFGSGGREFGIRLAKELDIPFYDKDLISMAAEDSNLSAEERYACRRDVFSLLPDMDWGELRQMGSAENPDDAIFGLMTWLEDQASYSSAEILWLQMGCTAAGLDGAYSERYALLAVLLEILQYDLLRIHALKIEGG